MDIYEGFLINDGPIDIEYANRDENGEPIGYMIGDYVKVVHEESNSIVDVKVKDINNETKQITGQIRGFIAPKPYEVIPTDIEIGQLIAFSTDCVFSFNPA